MALSKTNILNGEFLPRYNFLNEDVGQNPPVLDSYRVKVNFQILDDSDGSLISVFKEVDIWPLLTPSQQNTLKNITKNIIDLAVARA